MKCPENNDNRRVLSVDEFEQGRKKLKEAGILK
jgi:hypothetical protein